MSETIVQNVDPNAMVDLFGDLNAGAAGLKENTPKFGAGDTDSNIFNSGSTGATDTPNSGTSGMSSDSNNESDSESSTSGTQGTAGTSSDEPNLEEADILGGEQAAKPEGKILSDLSQYYEDRIKAGKFVEVQDEDGKPFIPKTAEEYDEVLELQINYRLDEAKKEVEKRWYDTKSPAWKAVSKYAELVDDPSQLIPFLQGVRTIQSVANINEDEIEGAEKIVRTRLEQRGDPDDIIDQQIEALKTTDKLISTAKQYKPLILNQEKQALAAQIKQEEEQNAKYELMVEEIREKALGEIEKPLFGKIKLKQEEKAAIYDLIAQPSEETSGYAIYGEIDRLFDQRDFETLKMLSLLLTKKEAFFNYLGNNIANQTAASLEKKLRLAGDSRKASGNDYTEEVDRPVVNRNQFKSKPTFGR